jgi:hypothetical protein
MARILAHLERTAPEQYPTVIPLGARAPPARSRLLCERDGDGPACSA